ncbi:MAG: hypothetical protein KDD33_10655 [Bdellovibrionales bacterium]|nr:hypothetical protein [Bdellovibrionales bacterium]
MKFVIFALTFFGFATTLTFLTDDTIGTHIFLESLGEVMGRPTEHVELFQSSKYNTADNQKLVERWKSIMQKYEGSNDPNGFSLNQQMLKKLANGEKIMWDWLGRKVNRNDLSELKNIYKNFKPIYTDLLGNPNAAKMKSYKEALNKEAEKSWRMEPWLKCASQFTGSPVSSAKLSKIALYPVPNAQQAYGESLGGMEMLGTACEHHDLHGDIGIVFHEKFHSLMRAIPNRRQAFLEATIKRELGPADQNELPQFLQLWEEAMATVAGQVWAYKKATHKDPPEPWYADEAIDKFTKKVASLSKKYLDQCKPMDKDFFKAAVAEYKKLPPEQRKAHQDIMPPQDEKNPGEEEPSQH